MRNMSFMLTTEQMRDESKDVTRRLGWWNLKPGDIVMACVKCQGLGKGGKIQRIHPIEIVSVMPELLVHIIVMPYRGTGKRSEMEREGFPEFVEEWQFTTMFAEKMKCNLATTVNRIEFKHRKDLL